MSRLAWVFCILVAAAGLVMPLAILINGGQFSSGPRIVVYGLLPVCIAVIAIIAIMLGDVARKFLLANGIAVGIALVAAETYVAIKLRNQSQAEGKALAAKIYRSPQRDGHRAYPPICGIDFNDARLNMLIDGKRVLPVSGLSNNLLNPESNDRAEWRFSDRYGFNNPPGQWEPTPVPVLVVGDSFAYGSDVPIGRGFVDRLRERVGQVVNLGCIGNGPLLELASLVEYGPITRPRVVVWAYFEGNDLNLNLPSEMNSPILRGYLNRGFSQNLVQNNDKVDQLILNYLDRMVSGAIEPSFYNPSRLGLKTITLPNLRHALGLRFNLDPQSVAVFEQTMRLAKSVVAEWGGKLVFVYLPTEGRYVTRLGRWDAAAYGDEVNRIVRNLDIPVIDIAEEFWKRPQPASLFAGHYTIEGYSLVGDIIADEIAKSAGSPR